MAGPGSPDLTELSAVREAPARFAISAVPRAKATVAAAAATSVCNFDSAAPRLPEGGG